jgi:hypothetical protein
MTLTWLALTTQGSMVGDYISTSFVGSVAFPAIAVAAAGTPTQNLDEAMFTTSSGLTVSIGGAAATTAGAAADGSSSLSFTIGPLNR